jgi:hypothetical protein
MKRLTLILALFLSSYSAYSQGTYTCGGNSISYGAGELIDKGTSNGTIKHVYVEKNESTLVLNSIGMDEKTKDTLTFYSFSFDLKNMANTQLFSLDQQGTEVTFNDYTYELISKKSFYKCDFSEGEANLFLNYFPTEAGAKAFYAIIDHYRKK